MVEYAEHNKDVLKDCSIFAEGTKGKLLARKIHEIHLLKSGPLA